jgi:hypothetical protein
MCSEYWAIGLVLLRVVEVWHGDPAVPGLLLAEPSDPREIHVIQRDEVAVLRRVREGVLPPSAGRLLIDVELDRDRRVFELRVRRVDLRANNRYDPAYVRTREAI